MDNQPSTATEVAYDQPTSTPTPKVLAGLAGGLVAALVVLIVDVVWEGGSIPGAAGALISTLAAFKAAYDTKDKKSVETVRVIQGGR